MFEQDALIFPHIKNITCLHTIHIANDILINTRTHTLLTMKKRSSNVMMIMSFNNFNVIIFVFIVIILLGLYKDIGRHIKGVFVIKLICIKTIINK